MLLGIAILAVGLAAANRSETPVTETQETTSLVPASDGGMRAYIDPETGTIGSMPPSGDLPGSTQSEPEPTFEQVVLPDGSVMVDLKGAGQEYYILELDANG
jgi:hypothetical protein